MAVEKPRTATINAHAAPESMGRMLDDGDGTAAASNVEATS
ncbi:MAG: hypothetical protein ACREQQ_05680 [Candidatus Binatia bacterium]